MATTEVGDPKSGPEIHQVENFKDIVKDDHGHVEGNALLVSKDGEVRRIPVPSNDPNDPLNFKPWQKYALVFCCCWFSIMGLSMASGLGAILSVFMEMYMAEGYTASQVVLLITLPTLCIGLGNYIILPLSLAFGRRPVFLVAMVILLASTIGAATQNSYNGHLATRIIQGLSTGASESLLPLMLSEVTFLHERSRIFGLYWMVQNALSSILNLSASYLNSSLGWRWYYWIFVITVSVGIVIAYLFAFETQFTRPIASLDGQLIVTDEFGVTHIVPDSEAQEFLANLQASGINPAALDPSSPSDGAAVSERKSYLQLIRPWSKPHPHPVRVILRSWMQMVVSLLSPGLLYAVLTSAVVLGCAVAISLTYDAVFLGYGWPAKDIGLINIGGVIGALLGMLYCTFSAEPFVLWMAKRNRGVHTPEHHLLTLAPPAVIGFAMLFLYGWTAEGGSTWWGPYMAWTLFEYAFTAVIIISTTFASEAAVHYPGPALVVVVGTKNLVSFGLSYGLTPMVAEHGYKWAFGVLAGIYMAVFLLGIPVYMYNGRFRAYAARKKQITGEDGGVACTE